MNVHELFPSRFLKGEEIEGKQFTLAIRACTLEEMGKERERNPVLWFEKAKKGLVLNKTNAMTIAALYGSDTDQWVGKRVTLYTERIRIGGEQKVVVRVAKQVPPAPEPTVMSTPEPRTKPAYDEGQWAYLKQVAQLSARHDSLFDEPSDVGLLIGAMREVDEDEEMADMPTTPSAGKAHSMYSYLLELIEETVGADKCGEPILSYLLGRVVWGATPPKTGHRFLLDDLKPDGEGEFAEAVIATWGVIQDNLRGDK